ncbi:PhzF family phenazine biosynthesis isomerase [Streptomyces sp. Vc74B-19]|uniref:PhzF family phenazine biosynthesis protein n=1 Tax=unclassified Streptomyces TaxID=2593676 RepID=UPI001BFC6789|nr:MULTISPECIES: PhzF family phenazine biosynthesis isomerase [unclassified Streptomyces]MBT3165294.1 PhzF family phenazine biosynthesis isomerase [Streptomyces sp. Vc74B-19]MCO4694407.1 PhzF family phenazine biosynthesis protein [Streptomyces sp. RO-S4]MDU0301006.1 PhzF family phenazine biosynthesis isomerase [Streptomyces sp. PAL114]
MGRYEYVVADVFTDVPLEGNPTAVFLDASGLSPGRMQQIAQEMHLSETVFVLPAENDGDVRVRIFTPVNELPFAGHPTLGAAVVLGESHDAKELRMETAKGTVTFELERDDDGRTVAAAMWQPLPVWRTYDRTDELLAALDLVDTGSTLPVEVYDNGPRHVFVGLDGVPALSSLEPDQRILARLPDMAANCFTGSGNRWRLRMFSPAYGVVEDAATGSAAGSIAVHLARYGLAPFGEWIDIRQGIEMGRPSTMRARVTGTPDRIDAVQVAGSAVVVARATLFVQP